MTSCTSESAGWSREDDVGLVVLQWLSYFRSLLLILYYIMWVRVICNNTFQIGSVDNVISVPKEHSVVGEAFATLVFFCLIFRTLSLYV